MKRRKFFSCIEVDSDEDHPHSHPIKKIKNNT